MSAPEPVWDYRIPVWTIRAVLGAMRGMAREGIENLPRRGPLIVAANHVSVMDPPLIGVVVNEVRYPHFVGKEELFRTPVFGDLLRRWGVIPLGRGRGDVRAVRGALGVLKAEGCMVVFPEGTRSRTGLPGRPKPGIGLLARESGALVVPARVLNTERWFRRGRLTVRFGAPLRYEAASPGGGETADGGRRADRRFAQKVMEEILRL
ncbi:MAG: lysophospholipid acyltransferase family protein [Elusimicrobiota bacterium]